MSQSLRVRLRALLSLGMLAALLAASDAAAEGCRRALAVCGRVIVPSLFPFLALSSFVSALGLPGLLGRVLTPFAMRLYGVSGAGASALVIGLTGGYPAGAAYLAKLEKSGAITTRECERLLAFCNNSGPAFLVGAVGMGVFRSVRIGLLLYGVHILAALLTGLFFRNGSSFDAQAPVFLDTADPFSALTDAVRDAAQALVNICGFVLFFSALTAVLDAGGALSLLCGLLAEHCGWPLSFSRAMLTGFFELGSGIAAMEGLAPSPATLALAAFLCGWGGLSVCFQSLALLKDSKAKGALLLTGHLLRASLGAALAFAVGVFLK